MLPIVLVGGPTSGLGRSVRLLLHLLIENAIIVVVEVAVDAADLVLVHHDRLLCLIFRGVLEYEPVIIVGQPTVLVGDADNFLISLAPALSRPPYLNFDDFGSVFLDQWELELLEKLAHNERALVLDQVLLDSLLLVLTSLVHQSQH